ncbi:hypothetical protein [Alloactinosynnema sp. L-07]|uniref:P-loop NTPase fold protein n=1 Tax=Alloactinosynnema sp. L-07 TaxID=1653480 RepID=UPI00065EFC8C|nr:P-loop NTPase fold protein [Alloactinosynnema sp. L-07]CRK57707.1 hypothetical protein [Alloactinosynnema sp. L-07]
MTDVPSLGRLAEEHDEVLPLRRGTAGEGVTIGLVCGQVYPHPWFEGAVADAVDDLAMTSAATMMAGLVLQRAPAARLISCGPELDADGRTMDGAALGAISTATENGAHILLFGVGREARPDDALSITYARVVSRAKERIGIVVAPAGDYGVEEPGFPANVDGVIAVAGMVRDPVGGWTRSVRSGRGAISAPCLDLLTTTIELGAGAGYGRNSGTAMAAALVAGEIAATMSRLGVDAAAAVEIVAELPMEAFLEPRQDNAAGAPPRLASPAELADPTTVLSDYWTTEDRLGYWKHAEALASFLVDAGTRPPLAIAVKGPWGAGKTSLLRMVRDRLDPPQTEHTRRSISLTSDSQGKLAKISRREPRLLAVLKLLRRNNLAPVVDVRGTTYGTPIRTTTLATDSPSHVDGTPWRPTVWFNPWMYQTGEQVWAGLAHDLIRQTTERMSSVDRERFWLALNLSRVDTEAVRRRIYRIVLSRLLPTLAWLGAVVAIGLVLTLAGIPVLSSLRPAGVSVGVIGVVLAQVISVLTTRAGRVLPDLVHPPDVATSSRAAVSDLTGGIGADIADPKYRARTGFLHLVHHDVTAVLDLIGTAKRPLVVFIDDLDRCTPTTVAQMVEALNLFLAGQFPHCVFVVAMEPEMVASQLEVAYGRSDNADGPGLGWRFLDKLVQLAITLPTPTDDAVREFIGHTLSGGGARTDHGVERQLSEERVRAYEQELAAVRSVDDIVANVRGLEGIAAGQIGFESEHVARHLSPEAKEAARRILRRRLGTGDPEMDSIIAAVVSHLGWNPREVKRFVNLLRFYDTIRQEYLLAGAEQEMTIYQLAKLAVLAIRWPHLRSLLAAPTGTASRAIVLTTVENTLRDHDRSGSIRSRIAANGVDQQSTGRLDREPELLAFLADEPPIGPGAVRFL